MVQKSISKADWRVADPAPEALFARFPEYPRPVVQLLHNRGLETDEEIERFLHPAYPDDLSDPFSLGGMRDAVTTVQASIAAGERIVVHGDYDADGLTATTVLHGVLRELGATVDAFIPSRYEEGYGVAASTLEKLRHAGTGLVVTVDCGISDGPAIAAARKAGLKVVVTDHHIPPAGVPEAEAVVNPNLPDDPYPNKALTGVGVAFKVAQALLAESDRSADERERIEKWLLDLVAIGTVADMAELRGENRALVRYGLLVLKQTRRPGLRELMRLAGIRPADVTAERIGFAIAPRLNAPGRVGHAREALALLLAEDSAEARRLAVTLEETNQERQRLTLDAVGAAQADLSELTDDDRLIFLEGEWKSGVVGLVAGRLVREYARPAVVVERGETLSRGSVRSIPGFHVAEALQEHGELLKAFGGHAQAGGFTVETAKLQAFRERLTAFARQTIAVESLRPQLAIEAVTRGDELNWELMDALADFEPFGIGNPKPLFLWERVTVDDIATVGQDGSHLKLRLRPEGGSAMTALAFRMADRKQGLVRGATIDLVGRPVVNVFNGSKSLEWHVEDFRPA